MMARTVHAEGAGIKVVRRDRSWHIEDGTHDNERVTVQVAAEMAARIVRNGGRIYLGLPKGANFDRIAAPVEDAARYLAANTRRDPDGCWTYVGHINTYGYGQLKASAHRGAMAHRFAYELAKGPIPDGLQLDHLCRNRACVNPDHLEPVTLGENVRRGLNGVLRTHCKHGHEFTPENTRITKSGRRECRKCRAAHWQNWYQAKKLTGGRNRNR